MCRELVQHDVRTLEGRSVQVTKTDLSKIQEVHEEGTRKARSWRNVVHGDAWR